MEGVSFVVGAEDAKERYALPIVCWVMVILLIVGCGLHHIHCVHHLGEALDRDFLGRSSGCTRETCRICRMHGRRG